MFLGCLFVTLFSVSHIHCVCVYLCMFQVTNPMSSRSAQVLPAPELDLLCGGLCGGTPTLGHSQQRGAHADDDSTADSGCESAGHRSAGHHRPFIQVGVRE